MAIVSKKKNVASTAPVEKKAAAPAKKSEAPAKKTVEKTEAPVTKKTEGKKISLTGNNKTPKSFEIKEGGQATQEAFIDRFYKKLVGLGYDVNKEQTKAIKKAYGQTLAEVTDIASFQDVDAGIYYARRYIKDRVTEPPKAKDGLKTLMKGHYELKVRKLLGDETDFKFFGDVNEDGTVFITVEGEEIAINDEVEVKPVATKKKATVKKPVVVEEEAEDEEVVEVEETEEEDDFDDFLEDEE